MRVHSSSTHKKVLVETFDGQQVRGYVNPRHLDRAQGLELLDASGQRQELPWKKIKVAWFVRDWEENLAPPNRRVFPRRPRLEGLWVRLRFRDDEMLEGILVNDLLHLDPQGFLLTPPDLHDSHQKAFVPRTALAALEVLGVNPRRGEQPRRRRRAPPEAKQQPGLFTE